MANGEQVRQALSELRKNRLFGSPMGELAQIFGDAVKTREYLEQNDIEFRDPLPGEWESYSDFYGRTDPPTMDDNVVDSRTVEELKDAAGLKELIEQNKIDPELISEAFHKPNVLYQAWQDFAQEVLFQCKLIALGVDSPFTDYTIKPNTGTLYRTLAIEGPNLQSNQYYFLISVPPYYKYLAAGRQPDASLYGKTFAIPADRVYNITDKDRKNAAKYGGMTFRKFSSVVAIRGVAERDFVRSVITKLWEQYSVKIDNAAKQFIQDLQGQL